MLGASSQIAGNFQATCCQGACKRMASQPRMARMHRVFSHAALSLSTARPLNYSLVFHRSQTTQDMPSIFPPSLPSHSDSRQNAWRPLAIHHSQHSVPIAEQFVGLVQKGRSTAQRRVRVRIAFSGLSKAPQEKVANPLIRSVRDIERARSFRQRGMLLSVPEDAPRNRASTCIRRSPALHRITAYESQSRPNATAGSVGLQAMDGRWSHHGSATSSWADADWVVFPKG